MPKLRIYRDCIIESEYSPDEDIYYAFVLDAMGVQLYKTDSLTTRQDVIREAQNWVDRMTDRVREVTVERYTDGRVSSVQFWVGLGWGAFTKRQYNNVTPSSANRIERVVKDMHINWHETFQYDTITINQTIYADYE